jgi:hypothetical protein
MIKKIERSGNSGTGQLGLDGRVVGNGTESLSREEREEIGLLKSALQKYVRRGLGERAAYVAYQLSNKKTGWILWRRMNIIAVEDCLDGTVILAVSELGRQAMKYGYETWDGRRCAVAAAILMAESKKDRRSDEFLELMDVAEKGTDDEELKTKMEDLAKIEDYVHDQHTASGRRMGRGDLFWYEVSSETANKTSGYEEWRRWFKPLMVRLAKEE